MRKFRFKLEAVQRLRKSKEQEALRAFAECQQAVRDEIARRDALVNAMSESLRRRESLGSVPVTSAAFIVETDFITGSKVRIAAAENAIRRAERRMERAMQEYLIAKRATKTIDRLRERAVEKFRKEKALHEQRQLDDLYTMRARMNSGDGALDGHQDGNHSEEQDAMQVSRNAQEAAG